MNTKLSNIHETQNESFNTGDLQVLAALNKILRLVFWDEPGTNILDQPAASICNTEEVVMMETAGCSEMSITLHGKMKDFSMLQKSYA